MNKALNLILACLGMFSTVLIADDPLVIYTQRHYEADEKLFQQFTEETGIELQILKAGASELLERLKAEGDQSKADIFITVDAARLGEAKAQGIFEPVESDYLTSRIPAPYRDPDGHWFAFSMRARIIAYAPERVKETDLSTYEDLADPKWRGRILVRSSENLYNQSLLASIIGATGETEAMKWAQGVRKNMARPPQGSDRDQIRAVAKGLGDIAIVNSYYVGLLLNSSEKSDREAGQAIKLFFPNQEGRGTHMNISGGGILKVSDQKENAMKFLEFMLSDCVQDGFPTTTYEYPVAKTAEWSELQKSWGTFKSDSLNLSDLFEHAKNAVQVFNQAGWE